MTSNSWLGAAFHRGKGYVETFTLGDDPLAIARRLLRAKWDKHDGDFYAPIRYPTKGYH